MSIGFLEEDKKKEYEKRDLDNLTVYVSSGQPIKVMNVIAYEDDGSFFKIKYISMLGRVAYKFIRLDDISLIEVENFYKDMVKVNE